MNVKQKIGISVATAAGLAAVGVGVGYALGGDDDTVTGADADHARAAALMVVPGTAGKVDKEHNEGNAVYGVDVTKTDGTKLEVHLDKDFHVVGTEPAGAENDGDDG
jgi:hypothetical protein